MTRRKMTRHTRRLSRTERSVLRLRRTWRALWSNLKLALMMLGAVTAIYLILVRLP